MSAVQDLVRALETRGVRSEWISTGGGCYALAVNFGETHDHPESDWQDYELLITDRDDVFGAREWISDDTVSGFQAVLYRALGPWGERATDDGFLIYATTQEAGVSFCEVDEDERHLVTDLNAEVVACADAVAFVVRAVESAESEGRSKGRILLDPTNAVVPFSRG